VGDWRCWGYGRDWQQFRCFGVILVALYTTKVSTIFKNGIWSTLHEARKDVSMLLRLVFLAIVAGGSLALDQLSAGQKTPKT
jgi:uncharacterized membrane protein YphA (DoxX/SURF4 family)